LLNTRTFVLMIVRWYKPIKRCAFGTPHDGQNPVKTLRTIDNERKISRARVTARARTRTRAKAKARESGSKGERAACMALPPSSLVSIKNLK